MTDPIQPISAHELLRQTATPTPDITAQAQRFEQLMAQSPQAPQPEVAAAPAPSPGHPTAMSSTIQSLDAASRHVVADIQKFVAESPAMDLQTLTSRSMELNLHVATQGLQFTACTSVAQSSKNGLQTLMKNQ
jgi:type III secretion inner rod protein HrpB2